MGRRATRTIADSQIRVREAAQGARLARLGWSLAAATSALLGEAEREWLRAEVARHRTVLDLCIQRPARGGSGSEKGVLDSATR
jgi:hypothetical protein